MIKKYGIIILFGIFSLLYFYRFIFTHSFATGTVKDTIYTSWFHLLAPVDYYIEFKKDTLTISVLLDRPPAGRYKKGDKVQIIYTEKDLRSVKLKDGREGKVVNGIVGDRSVWLYNLLYWLLLMLFVVGVSMVVRFLIRINSMKTNPKDE